MSRTSPSPAKKQVLLRLPEHIRERLDAAAETNGRSLTAEVLARLESTFPASESWLRGGRRSPKMQIEKRLIALETLIEERIEEFERRLSALEGRLK